jgi:hypothetical protein
MPQYIEPAGDEVNFQLQAYTEPTGDEVNFDLLGQLMIKIKLAGEFVEKPRYVKIAGTFENK